MKIKIIDNNGKEISTDFIIHELSKNQNTHYLISVPLLSDQIDNKTVQYCIEKVAEEFRSHNFENYTFFLIKDGSKPIIQKVEVKEINEADN